LALCYCYSGLEAGFLLVRCAAALRDITTPKSVAALPTMWSLGEIFSRAYFPDFLMITKRVMVGVGAGSDSVGVTG
jgi:hypothetical protein